jgi:hypothetical protein
MVDALERGPQGAAAEELHAGGAAAGAGDAGLSDERLDEFEAEVKRLKVKGGASEPERRLVALGVILTVAGLVAGYVGLQMVRSAPDALAQGDGMATTVMGVGVALVGALIWVRYSLSRYLRFWLVRQVYEQRAQTDRVVAAIERSTRP